MGFVRDINSPICAVLSKASRRIRRCLSERSSENSLEIPSMISTGQNIRASDGDH